MVENFPNWVKEKVTQVQKVQKVPIKMNLKRPTHTHNIIKMSKIKLKERILKEGKERQLVTYKWVLVRLNWFLKIYTSGHRGWNEIFKIMKNKEVQLKLFYPTGWHLKLKAKQRAFQTKKLKKLITTTQVLHKLLKGLLSEEEKEKWREMLV